VVKLICKQVKFYSRGDEDVFFEWISKIKAIKKYEGVGDEIHLYAASSKISDKGLRELTALFYRYNINTQQLQQFINEKNSQWYGNKPSSHHNVYPR
jgi:hypothetical protein